MRKLDKAFVADSILIVKREIFNENCITWYECNRIADSLKEKLKNNGYDVDFSLDIINATIFYFFPGIIKKKQQFLSIDLSATIRDDKLKDFIYDKKFIQSCLYDMYLERLSLLAKHDCKTCNSMSTSANPNYSCSRWYHNIKIS